MKLVIEITEDDFERIKNISFVEDTETMLHQSLEDRKSTMMLFRIMDAIQNSTPLPEKHGRLKDIDAFITKVKADRKHSAYLKSWTADDVLNALNNSYAPTIIEGSDKEWK